MRLFRRVIAVLTSEFFRDDELRNIDAILKQISDRLLGEFSGTSRISKEGLIGRLPL